MPALALLVTTLGTLRDYVQIMRRADENGDRGSISVEQVLITAGLVAAALVAVGLVKAAVTRYGAGI